MEYAVPQPGQRIACDENRNWTFRLIGLGLWTERMDRSSVLREMKRRSDVVRGRSCYSRLTTRYRTARCYIQMWEGRIPRLYHDESLGPCVWRARWKGRS